MTAPAARATVGWWRRNAVALVALAVLVPATIAAIGWWEWRGYFVERQWQVVEAAPGETLEIAGVVVGPAALREAPGELDAPAGARQVVVEVPVVPGGTPLGCGVPTLVEPATGRSWRPDTLLDGGDQTFCADASAPLTLVAGFAVPADVGALAVDLELTVDGPERPRLHLDG